MFNSNLKLTYTWSTFLAALLISSITSAALTTGHLNSEDKPYCKVNKALITIAPGSGPQTVTITGSPGAITSTSPVSAYVKNEDTGVRSNITLAENMSFSIEVAAATGQKVRVYATNRQGKRSYGTFDIPTLPSSAAPRQLTTTSQPSVATSVLTPQTFGTKPQPAAGNSGSHTTSAVKEYSIMNLHPDTEPALMINGETITLESETNTEEPDGTNLAVVIMIVNTDNGQVLSTSQITGKSKTYADKSPENFKIMIQRILDRCKNIISSEILRPDFKRTQPDPTDSPISN